MSKAEPSGGNASQVQVEPAENQIAVYQPNETVRLDVHLENETVWLTQEQMSLLFGRDQSVVARHIGNIFKEGELNRDSVYAKNAYTASDGKTYQVAFYNLDVVISVGYRVKSVQGTRFRQWATGVLKEYLIRGYAVNTRLAHLEDKVDRRLAEKKRPRTAKALKADVVAHLSARKNEPESVRRLFHKKEVRYAAD